MNCSKPELLDKLAEIVGAGWVKTGVDDLEKYGKDWTKAYPANPMAIVLPNGTDEVIALVQLANLHEIALVPSGGRTGLSGGAVASNEELVVALDRMNTDRLFASLV
jgi:FAD/FMN-containing dehydrogenase